MAKEIRSTIIQQQHIPFTDRWILINVPPTLVQRPETTRTPRCQRHDVIEKLLVRSTKPHKTLSVSAEWTLQLFSLFGFKLKVKTDPQLSLMLCSFRRLGWSKTKDASCGEKHHSDTTPEKTLTLKSRWDDEAKRKTEKKQRARSNNYQLGWLQVGRASRAKIHKKLSKFVFTSKPRAVFLYDVAASRVEDGEKRNLYPVGCWLSLPEPLRRLISSRETELFAMHYFGRIAN